MNTKPESNGFLTNLRVLDLADEKAGFCSKLLADLGARVIKVEKPDGDPSRKKGPFLRDSTNSKESLSFFYNNTNKLGITLNLEHPEGRDLFLRLTQKNDIVIETFAPGFLQRLGLGFEDLIKTNPEIILVSVSGFGQEGPRRDHKSCDLVSAALGGQMFVTGSRSEAPLKPFGEQSYYTASLFAAVGILLALRKRSESGRGDHIDISMQETAAASLDHVMTRFFSGQTTPERQGSLHWNNTFYIFPCRDGFFHMTLFQQWETLIEWLDSEGAAEDLVDDVWRDEAYRLEHLNHILEVLGRWTKGHTRAELFETGQLLRFPWAPVSSPAEILKSPQLEEREFFITGDRESAGGTLKYPRLPYIFSPQMCMPCKGAPSIGEDNLQVYREELGLTDEELERLSSKKVI